MMFLPNPNNYTEINHINNNPSDNFVLNLEWCDKNYNNKYRFTHGNASHKCENHPMTKLSNKDVTIIYYNAKINDMTTNQIINKYNITRSVAQKIKNKYRWKEVTDMVDKMILNKV